MRRRSHGLRWRTARRGLLGGGGPGRVRVCGAQLLDRVGLGRGGAVAENALAELVGAVLSAVENRAPLAISPPPPRYAPGTAIVVLGYGLLPDGTMRPTLVDRLRAGWLEAVLAPAAPVIVTGGNPHNGITEADAMAQWLVAHGIAPDRIHREPLARSTVENAAHSARLMREIGATTAVIVTSADHIDRAATDFAAAGVTVTAAVAAEQVPEPAVRLLRARGA
ncbi:YdcF family protein [Nocardia brasiliensis]|uniref:YdcF family protein n=1 Tax=Nocardia brasiliensis TaxID=37326 RepID=UPI0024557553|nr:YdcF family protein [Nocardia brasiliensis]